MHNIAQEYINDRNSDVVLVGNKSNGVPTDLGTAVENAWSETHQVFNLHKLSGVTPIAAVVSTTYNDMFQTWTVPDGSQPIFPSDR